MSIFYGITLAHVSSHPAIAEISVLREGTKKYKKTKQNNVKTRCPLQCIYVTSQISSVAQPCTNRRLKGGLNQALTRWLPCKHRGLKEAHRPAMNTSLPLAANIMFCTVCGSTFCAPEASSVYTQTCSPVSKDVFVPFIQKT